jgi:putative transposase
MPRQARLDAEGTVHHVIARGIERRAIFRDTADRERFVDRLGELSGTTQTTIYAWTLLRNHFHLLLRSGPEGLSRFMRRLMTGYAMTFNRRYRRSGHLFQNRFTSIVCEEEPYFLELVRYIHLNPLRAHLIKTMDDLDSYRWSGHRILIGRASSRWQDCDYVLSWFGRTNRAARIAYRRFMEAGVSEGKRTDLSGGGLIRSLGGPVRQRGKDRVFADDRILGTGAFVKGLLEEADERRRHCLSIIERVQTMKRIITERCEAEGIELGAVRGGSRAGPIPRLRSELASRLAGELGISYAEIARHLGVSTCAVTRMLSRRQRKSP